MRIARTVLPLALVAAAATTATAETIDERHATLGWQAENADVVALVEHVADLPAGESESVARFDVLDALKGAVEPGASLVVVHPATGHGEPWIEGAEHLVFLRPVGGGRFVSVAGSLAIRSLPDAGPARRFPGIVEAHVATLDAEGGVADPDRLRELLVGWAGDDDPGVAWSAVIDLLRHRGLHEGLTPAQRTALMDAYRRHPVGKRSKRALAHLIAAVRPEGAAAALVGTLGRAGARPLRGDLAAALATLNDPATAELVLRRLPEADAELREHLVLVLGAIGDTAAVPELRRRLSDDAAAVRVQAAHALGRIARAVRAADPEARIEARVELAALLARARTRNEQKASAWALAQLDQPEAYAHLRRVAETDTREDVRRDAARYLRRPRVSLILR